MISFKLGELVESVKAKYREFEIATQGNVVLFKFGGASKVMPLLIDSEDVKDISVVEVARSRKAKKISLYFSGVWKTEFSASVELEDGIYVRQGNKFVLKEAKSNGR